jgi:hypothetical protein
VIDIETAGAQRRIDVPADRPPKPGHAAWIALRPGRAEVFRLEKNI